MKRTGAVTRVDESTFEVDGVAFVADWTAGVSRADRFAVMKESRLLENYVSFLAEHCSDHVVELGVREGGSTALLALAGGVSKLVAFELTNEPAPALVDLIEQRRLGDRVRPYFGVDQADRERLAAIVADEFADQPLDLVIDDASHRYRPTLATFETLFPRVAADRWYIIEDWCWEQHRGALVHGALGVADPESTQALLVDLAESDPAAAAKFERRVRDALENPTPEIEAMFAIGLALERPDHQVTEERPVPPAEPRLLDLVFRLLLGVSRSREVIAEVRVDPDWVMIRRGPASLDPASFRLADVAPDYQGMLQG